MPTEGSCIPLAEDSSTVRGFESISVMERRSPSLTESTVPPEADTSMAGGQWVGERIHKSNRCSQSLGIR